MEVFLSVFQRNNTTLYIHCFVHHLHDFIDRNIKVNLFNQEGAEHQNYFTIKQYFHSTTRINQTKMDFLL